MALKIIKNIDRYRDAALSEVQVLEQLKTLDPGRRWYVQSFMAPLQLLTSKTKLCFLGCSQVLVFRYWTGSTTMVTSVSPLSCSASALMIFSRRITFSRFQSNTSGIWRIRFFKLYDVSKGRVFTVFLSG